MNWYVIVGLAVGAVGTIVGCCIVSTLTLLQINHKLNIIMKEMEFTDGKDQG